MRRPRLRTVLIGAGATLALIGGSTAAYAVSVGPIDSSGVVHGCYKTTATGNSHTVVLQDAGTACPSGYTAIKWNQKGPTGPQGPTGPAGPGTTAIDTFVGSGTSMNIAMVGAFTVNANCEPSGITLSDREVPGERAPTRLMLGAWARALFRGCRA